MRSNYNDIIYIQSMRHNDAIKLQDCIHSLYLNLPKSNYGQLILPTVVYDNDR